MYLLPRKSRSSHCRCFIKEGLQGPAKVFFCENCKTFNNTYFEKHLRTAASENQKEVTPEPYYPFKPFIMLNFAITKWFCYVTCFTKVFLLLFFFSQTWYFCLKKVVSYENTYQVRCYHFFIVEIIDESMNLVQMTKYNRKLLSPW